MPPDPGVVIEALTTIPTQTPEVLGNFDRVGPTGCGIISHVVEVVSLEIHPVAGSQFPLNALTSMRVIEAP
jgi:hypothetical protein